VNRAKAIQARMERVRRLQSGWSGVSGLILFYLALLGGQAATFAIGKASDSFTTVVAGTGILSAIVVIAAFQNRETLRDCTRRSGFGPRGYGLVLLASIPLMIAVWFYAHGLGRLFHLHREPELDPYNGHGLAWAFLLVAVLPPIFEELGFRGVVFSLLGRGLEPKETILLSAVAFGLLHLSVPSLVTHVPLGLYFGWLRQRSGSLYPSMFAHFLHNGLVVLAESAHWLPGSE
jgi:membrane protease YdiL (CAAX protease family)